MGARTVVYRVLVGRSEGKDHLEDPSLGGMILKWIFRKRNVGVWTGFLAEERDRWRAFVNAVMNRVVR